MKAGCEPSSEPPTRQLKDVEKIYWDKSYLENYISHLYDINYELFLSEPEYVGFFSSSNLLKLFPNIHHRVNISGGNPAHTLTLTFNRKRL